MKRIARYTAIIIALVAFAMPAHSQFSWGIKAGLNVNNLTFKDAQANITDPDNRAGFTGGLTCEFTAPIIGIGFDASVMYVRRTNEVMTNKLIDDPYSSQAIGTATFKKDYIEIPINLKWKISLPVVGSIVAPYVFTGPSFAFLTSKKDIVNAYKTKTFDAFWNLGGGLQLFRKLQIGAYYGWGMTKALDYLDIHTNQAFSGKNNGWTVTAALFF